MLKNSLVHRQERWQKFRAHITSRAKIQFIYLLSERGFRGRLLANHKKKLLDVQVNNSLQRTPKRLPCVQLCLLASRLSQTAPRIASVEERRLCLEEKSRSRRYAFYWPYGKPWALLSVVWTNCKPRFCASFASSSLPLTCCSDVYMDSVNRKMAIDILVSFFRTFYHNTLYAQHPNLLHLPLDVRCSMLSWTPVYPHHPWVSV